MCQASSGSTSSEFVRALALVFGVVALLLVVGTVAAVLGIPAPWAQAMQTTGAFGGAWWFASRVGWDATSGRCGAGDLVLAATAGIGLALLGVGLLSIELILSPVLREHAASRAVHLEALLRPNSTAWIPVVVIVVGVLPGVFEERWFRGVIRNRMPNSSPHVRVVVVAVLFAVAHLDPANLLPLFVVGAGFGWVAEQHGGWWAAAVTHCAHNVFNGVVVPRVVTDDGLSVRVAVGWVALGSGIALAAFFASELKQHRGNGANER